VETLYEERQLRAEMDRQPDPRAVAKGVRTAPSTCHATCRPGPSLVLRNDASEFERRRAP
jgi:hypothetical protein